MHVLRHHAFRWYAAGSLGSLVGTWAQRLALGWLTWELTGSAAWLGAVALADAAPLALLALPGGVIADRTGPVRLITATLSVSAVTAAALAGLALTVDSPNPATLALIVLLALINGVATALGQPARMALVPRLVPRADVAAAVALGSVSFSLARLVGPALGGGLVAWAGPAAVFGFNALSYGLFIVAVVRIAGAPGLGPSAPRRGRTTAGGLGPDIKAALIEIRLNSRLLAAVALTGLAAFWLRPYLELLPAVAAESLAAGPGALAALATASGAGALVGGLVMLGWGGGILPLVGLTATLGAGGALIGLAGIDRLEPALLWAGALGLLLVISATAVQSTIALESPEPMRARIMGVYLTVLRLGPALGAVALGLAADWTRLDTALGLAGACGIVCVLSLWLWTRRRSQSAPRHRENWGHAQLNQ